ncbi:MAG: multidrug DMT transporter permease [Legionella sp.]|nr:MAG: multidrug DMT transporter permease [Legionella sp.]
MTIDKLLGNQSVIISLDVDKDLYDKLDQIAEAGFNVVEINATDTKTLSKVINQYPNLKIGAAGIIETQQLENCYQVGVHFASSPGFLTSIAQTAMIYTMNYLPGVATLSEAMAAASIGYQQVRPFPASLTFCAALNRWLPNLKIVPAEIAWEDAEHFLNLPAVAGFGIHNPDIKQLAALISGVFV